MTESKSKKRPARGSYWIENFRKLIRAKIKELHEKSVEVGKKGRELADVAIDGTGKLGEAFKLRIPSVVAIVLFSIVGTLVSPLAPAAFGVFAFELIKDLGSNLIWKMFESPMEFSAYFKSGKLEADIQKELENNREFQKKIGLLFLETQTLRITLQELVQKQDVQLLQSFREDIKRYPEIDRINCKSLLHETRDIVWSLDLRIEQEKYIKEFSNVPAPLVEPEQPTRPLRPVTPTNFEFSRSWWLRWMFFWIISVLIGALVIVFLFCYFFGVCKGFGHSSILPLATSTIMLFPTGTFTPVLTTIPNTPSFTPFITNTPTPVIPAVTDTPVQEVLGTFLLSTDTTGVEENGTKHSLKQGDSVSPIEWYGEDCQARVWWNGILVKIDWNTMAGKECP